MSYFCDDKLVEGSFKGFHISNRHMKIHDDRERQRGVVTGKFNEIDVFVIFGKYVLQIFFWLLYQTFSVGISPSTAILAADLQYSKVLPKQPKTQPQRRAVTWWSFSAICCC